MLKNALLVIATVALAACSTGKMNAEYGQLRVNTQMSSTVFLEPVSPEDQIVYVKVRSTTGNKGFRLQGAIEQEMRAIGYTITNDPKKANFMIQANIKNYTSTVKAADGTGESLVGAVVGGVLGSAIGGGKGQEIATTLGALAGGAAAQKYANSNVLVTYTAQVDIQVSQRAIGSIDYNTRSNASQGDSARTTANYKRASNWENYRTRLVSEAKKVGLTEPEATPAIVEDIVTSLSNMF